MCQCLVVYVQLWYWLHDVNEDPGMEALLSETACTLLCIHQTQSTLIVAH